MDQAESACKSRGGKLPLPENVNENADLLNAFKTVRPQAGVVMIGMSDLKSERITTAPPSMKIILELEDDL